MTALLFMAFMEQLEPNHAYLYLTLIKAEWYAICMQFIKYIHSIYSGIYLHTQYLCLVIKKIKKIQRNDNLR